MRPEAPNRKQPAKQKCWAILGLAGIFFLMVAVPTFGSTIEELAGNAALPSEKRAQLTCPDSNASGNFAAPVKIFPTPEVAFWVTYSDEDDLVRLVGEEIVFVLANLGPGNDTAMLYEIGAEFVITGDIGADTIMVCSMGDLTLQIMLGSPDLGRDSDQDVLIFESPVFTSVPEGMARVITVFGFDKETDKIVIRAPAIMLDFRKSSPNIGGVRIGKTTIKIFTPIDAPTLNYSDDELIYIPDAQ